MQNKLQRLGNIKDLKNIHWRHLVQSIIAFGCFSTLDSVADLGKIWLICASVAVVVIALLMAVGGKIKLGNWTNIFNILGAILCFVCHFFVYAFPFAVFFVCMSAGIRLIYARDKLNDYSTLVFVIASVLGGIILRFALIVLPIWVLSVAMLATLFNPIIDKRADADDVLASPVDLGIPVTHFVKIVLIVLVVFFLSLEIFGGLLTDEVSHTFPMQIVNFAYLFGFVLFLVAILFFHIRLVSMAILSFSVVAFLFFLVPPTMKFGVYALLFLGGGMELTVIAFPVTSFKGKYKHLGALLGVFVFRLALLGRGLVKHLSDTMWHLQSTLNYVLVAINIVFGLIIIASLVFWDRQELKATIASSLSREVVTITKEVIREMQAVKTPLPDDLSKQERRVAELILLAKSYREIATELKVSVSTVGKYAERIYTKAGVDGQKQFISRYLISNTLD